MLGFRIALLSVLLVTGAFLYIRLDALAEENKKLTAALEYANANITALDNVLEARLEQEKQERNLIDEIEKTPPALDGPTAPVLRSTLERLR